jgi:hypothetical protein
MKWAGGIGFKSRIGLRSSLSGDSLFHFDHKRIAALDVALLNRDSGTLNGHRNLACSGAMSELYLYTDSATFSAHVPDSPPLRIIRINAGNATNRAIRIGHLKA